LAEKNFYCDINMHGNKIRSLPDATTAQEPATLAQLQAIELTPGPKGDTGDTGPAGPAGASYLKYATTIGNGIDTVFTITHNFGTRDVVVQVRETAAPYGYMVPDSVQATDINSVAVSFTVAPTTNQYRVIILG
jgi:hypothetical protein